MKLKQSKTKQKLILWKETLDQESGTIAALLILPLASPVTAGSGYC
jgi:small neutral amino acid transporter SnatA (MarC family)